MENKYVTRQLLKTVYLTLKQVGYDDISLKQEELLNYVPKIEKILEENKLLDTDFFVKTPISETYDKYKTLLIEIFIGEKIGYFNDKYDTITLNCTDYYINKNIKQMEEYEDIINQCCLAILHNEHINYINNDIYDEFKTNLRNNLFEKYFEVEDGILLSDLVESTNFITQTWNYLHELLQKHIEDYDSWSRLEDIKEIEYENKKFLIIKVMIQQYIVIDLEEKKTLNEEQTFNILEEQLFIENFDERKVGENMYNKLYWFISGNNIEEIINYYKQNEKIFNYPTRIFYKITDGDVYTFLSIRLNDGIQLSFQGKDQILYETLFIKSDLTPSSMQDTKDRISIEKMREIFDRVPNIRIPKEYIPKEFFEDSLIKEEKVKSIKK